MPVPVSVLVMSILLLSVVVGILQQRMRRARETHRLGCDRVTVAVCAPPPQYS
jgi:hypothetical protein